MTTTPTPLPFTIETDGTSGKITVAGQDVSALVRSGTLQFGAGDIPALTLDLVPRAGRIDAVGVVTVNHGYDDPGARREFHAATANLIRNGLDLEELQRRVDARLDSMADSPLVATCAAIADMFTATVDHIEITSVSDEFARYVPA